VDLGNAFLGVGRDGRGMWYEMAGMSTDELMLKWLTGTVSRSRNTVCRSQKYNDKSILARKIARDGE